MLIATALIILLQFAVAAASPIRFVYLALWIQTIPYTWNWDAQFVYDTPVGPLNVVAMQLFGFCLASAAVICGHPDVALTQMKRYKWHMAFIALSVVSLSYAPSASYGLRMIAKLLGPFLFMTAVLVSVKSADELRKMETAVIGSGIVLIALTLFARVLHIDSDPNAVSNGFSGLGPPSMGPPVFSAHMLPVSMLALATYLYSRQFKMLLLLGACAICILAALQRTSAAAMYIGFSVVVFFGTQGIWRLVMPMIGIIGLPVIMIFSAEFRKRMFFDVNDSQQLLDDPVGALQKINGSGRFGMWDDALKRFFDPNPLQGSGIGATQEYLYGRAGAGVIHSEYVRLLCEVGIFGISLFLLAALSYLICLTRLSTNDNSKDIRKYALAALGSVVAYLIYCATDNGLDYVTQFGAYVFALVAMAYKAGELAALAPSANRVQEKIPIVSARPHNLMR